MDRRTDRRVLPGDDSSNHPQSNNDRNIRVTEHDVLSGRGINIAQHVGNERFRALVNTKYDVDYCSSYSLCEKRAVAEDIVAHIKTTLDPPGRFLKRVGRSQKPMRGLDGPWEELTKDEAIKKTCQALRDCNRHDRVGYAAAVAIPQDVQFYSQVRTQTGLSKRELAQRVAAQVAANQHSPHFQSEPFDQNSLDGLESQLGKRERGDSEGADIEPEPIGETHSMNTLHPCEWLGHHDNKRSKAERLGTPAPNVTPATAASSAILSGGTVDTFLSHGHSVQHNAHFEVASDYPGMGDQQFHNSYYYPNSGISDYSPVAASAASLMASHGLAPLDAEHSDHSAFEDPFDDVDSKPPAVDNHDFVDPLHLSNMDNSSNGEVHHFHPNPLQDFGPPSPMGHHDDDPLNDLHGPF